MAKNNYEKQPMKNTMSDKTRYIVIGLVTVILLGLLVFLVVFRNDTSNKKKTNAKSNSNGIAVEERNLSTKTLKEFYQQFDKENLNVIYYASSTCSFCAMETPILKQITKDYSFDYYDIDVSTLSDDEVTEIVKALGIEGTTPATVVTKKGKVVDINEGYVDGKEYVKFFAQNGIIPKDAIYKPEENLTDISYDEFLKISKENKTNLVLIDTIACKDCITVRGILSNLAGKNKFKINYLNPYAITQDNIDSLVDKDLKNLGYDEETFKEKSEVNIPLLLIIKNNKIQDYLLQSTEESDYIELLKKYKLIS